MIVTDFAVIEIIENLNHEQIVFLAHITYLHLLVAAINNTLVLVNAPLVIIIHLLNDKNSHLVYLLIHVLIVIEFDHTQILKAALTTITNLLLVSPNNPLHQFIIHPLHFKIEI